MIMVRIYEKQGSMAKYPDLIVILRVFRESKLLENEAGGTRTEVHL